MRDDFERCKTYSFSKRSGPVPQTPAPFYAQGITSTHNAKMRRPYNRARGFLIVSAALRAASSEMRDALFWPLEPRRPARSPFQPPFPSPRQTRELA